VKKVLQQSSASIARLLQHSRYLEYLSKRVLTYLPPEFCGKISVLGLSGKRKQYSLVLAAISPAWASKLRFYSPALKRSLSSEPQLSQLKKISIRVTATRHQPDKKKQANPVYSQNSAKIIQSSAEHIENEALKNALLRLAQNVSKSTSHEGAESKG